MAGAADFDESAQAVMRASRDKWFVGTGADVAAGLRDFARRWDVDEVMIHPVASAHRGVDAATSPAREATLELLAKELF